MINRLDQERLKNALLLDKRINTKQVVVASMRTNQSIKLLSAKLDKLNYIVNYRLNLMEHTYQYSFVPFCKCTTFTMNINRNILKLALFIIYII